MGMRPRSAASRRHLSASPFNATSPEPTAVESYAVDDRVTHDKFGLGRIVEVEEETAVVVAFGAQRVRVLTPFTKLTKL